MTNVVVASGIDVEVVKFPRPPRYGALPFLNPSMCLAPMPRSLLRSLPPATKPSFTSTTIYQYCISRLEGPDGVYSPASLIFSVTLPRRYRYAFPFIPLVARRDINLAPTKNRESISGKLFNRKSSRRRPRRQITHHGNKIVHLLLHIVCLGKPLVNSGLKPPTSQHRAH